jgi:hypothetical protein
MNERFRLAKMSPTIALLTAFLFLLPVGFIGMGLGVIGQAPGVLLVVGCVMIALWVGIGLWSRPTGFELEGDAFVIVWPVRRRRIALSEVRRVRVLDVRAFRKIYGWTPRIGVGGLWGIFGWLWSRDAGLIDIHASRLDGWVLIQRAAGHPIVVTPERPEAFAECIAPAGGVG